MSTKRQMIFRAIGFLIGAFLSFMGAFILLRLEAQGWVQVVVSLWMIALGVFLIRFGMTGKADLSGS